MPQWLRQSTATTAFFGPMVEATDGYTYKATTITLATGAGSILIRKSNSNTTGLAGAVSLAVPGWVLLPIAATDVDQLGPLQYRIGNVTNNMPVWADYLVVPANIYDSIVLGTDFLQVDVQQITGGNPSAAAVNANVILINNAVPTAITFNANVLLITGGAVSAATINANMIAINNAAPTTITFNANVLLVTGAAVSAGTINANVIAINNAAPTTITFNSNLLTCTGAAPSAAVPAYVLDYVMFTVGAQSITLKDAVKYIVAGVAGKLAGATTTAITLYGPSGEVRVSAVVASGNRTGVSYVTG